MNSMLRIKVIDIEKHRNETTFRPFLMFSDYFRQIGIEFIFSGDTYDLAWIGQATFIDRTKDYNSSVNWGIEQVNKIKGPKWIFDGQDSAALVGSYDVLLNTDAEFLLKNTLYREKKDYADASILGRIYWEGYRDTPQKLYARIDDFSRIDDVQLSGANWLSTIYPSYLYYEEEIKDIDVFAVFSYPGRKNYEFGFETSAFYNAHRKRCIDWLNSIPNIKIASLPNDGTHYLREDYYKLMKRSKIVVAPFGYGEIAPRDIEAAMFGCVLIKPDMSHINTIPKFYIPEETYYPCSWDFYDLPELITGVLNNYTTRTIETSRKVYAEEYRPEKLVKHIHTIFNQSKHFGC